MTSNNRQAEILEAKERVRSSSLGVAGSGIEERVFLFVLISFCEVKSLEVKLINSIFYLITNMNLKHG